MTKVPFDGAFAETRRLGCMYALRKELLQYVDEMWHEDWPHDQFFWCIAIARGTLYSYNKPLVKFRRHEDNNTPSNEKSRQNRAELARNFADISGELIANRELLELTADVVNTLTRSCTFNNNRAEYISKKNMPGVISLLPRPDCYTRFRAWIGDFVAVVK